jgi:hypothetical protein
MMRRKVDKKTGVRFNVIELYHGVSPLCVRDKGTPMMIVSEINY